MEKVINKYHCMSTKCCMSTMCCKSAKCTKCCMSTKCYMSTKCCITNLLESLHQLSKVSPLHLRGLGHWKESFQHFFTLLPLWISL